MLQTFTFTLLITLSSLLDARAQTKINEQTIPLSVLTASQPVEGEYKASYSPLLIRE